VKTARNTDLHAVFSGQRTLKFFGLNIGKIIIFVKCLLQCTFKNFYKIIDWTCRNVAIHSTVYRIILLIGPSLHLYTVYSSFLKNIIVYTVSMKQMTIALTWYGSIVEKPKCCLDETRYLYLHKSSL